MSNYASHNIQTNGDMKYQQHILEIAVGKEACLAAFPGSAS